jgi:hypothetical protein
MGRRKIEEDLFWLLVDCQFIHPLQFFYFYIPSVPATALHGFSAVGDRLLDFGEGMEPMLWNLTRKLAQNGKRC